MAQNPGVAQALETGLFGAAARQAVIASNIANMATRGYRRAELPFEQLLAESLEKGKPLRTDTLLEHVVRPATDPLNEHGNDVELDREVGALVKNSMLYKTYMRLLARRYRGLELAMQTG